MIKKLFKIIKKYINTKRVAQVALFAVTFQMMRMYNYSSSVMEIMIFKTVVTIVCIISAMLVAYNGGKWLLLKSGMITKLLKKLLEEEQKA